MYNIFRLTGRYAGGGLPPGAVRRARRRSLYQVAALIRTLDEADRPGAELRLRPAASGRRTS